MKYLAATAALLFTACASASPFGFSIPQRPTFTFKAPSASSKTSSVSSTSSKTSTSSATGSVTSSVTGSVTSSATGSVTSSATGSVTSSATGSLTSSTGSFTSSTSSFTSSTSSSTSSSASASGTAICLTNSTASTLVNGYGSLLSAYNNATANSILAVNFTDTSDSINWLAGVPLGSTTFASRADFEASQSTQPAIGFTVLSIDAVTCNVVAFRWSANLGSEYLVKGINVMYASNLNNTAAGWQISQMYAEFNSAAWAIDVGGSCST